MYMTISEFAHSIDRQIWSFQSLKRIYIIEALVLGKLWTSFIIHQSQKNDIT